MEHLDRAGWVGEQRVLVQHRLSRPNGISHRPAVPSRHGENRYPRRRPSTRHHIANCVAKSTTYGDLITKDRRSSPRKIDAAVGAIFAFDRAAAAAAKPVKKRTGFAYGF